MKYEIIMWFNHILKSIPGHIGCYVRNVFLPYKNGENVKIYDSVHIDNPSKLSFGDNVSINRGSILNAGGEISIGNDVLVGPGVVIYSQNHQYESSLLPISEQGYNFKKTKIGNNVWLGARVIVLPGVEIGDNVVVGAGSVVNKNIPTNSLAVGNPARVIKRLYETK